ncbi:hypothetical protein [Staphylococcus capitis]|uniref:hypothetical protein n=1 Tax=Staphylococcus capitis TaxID=29388 RepID=UPI003D04198C
MRRSAAVAGKVSKAIEPTYEAGSHSLAQVSPCDLPSAFTGFSDGDVPVDAFYVGSLKTAPKVSRAGGVRTESTLTLEALSAPPEDVRRAMQQVHAVRCSVGALNFPPSATGGPMPYLVKKRTATVAGNPAVLTTTSVDAKELDASGYYALLAHVRVIVSFRGHLVNVGVTYGRPGRPRDGVAIAGQAREQAVQVAERLIAELRKAAAAAPTTSPTPVG